MTWLTWLLLVAAVLLAGAVGLTVLGSVRWAAATQSLRASLEAGRAPASAAPAAVPTRYDVQEIAGLPAPVQRYFRAALTPGQAIVSAATIQMAGTFNLSATGEQWKPFTSIQRVTTRRAGFLWDARITILPGLTVCVVDSYIMGRGLLRARLQGLFTLADLQGGGEIARGEFMRFFAESPWYPTALLPSQGVRWEAVDERSAKATLVDGPIALTLLFRFDETGLIASFRAEARGGMVGKRLVQAPWEGRFSNYQTRQGMRVPLAGEVAWMRPQGRQVYFKGAITQLQHVFVP
ncbi:DUF6920 family protein [Pseudaquabacterium pictum]|uniref:Uncharacterized protein n=1 Tax=Pseudaquabacterium pictum TaxID=2315236 RepID=A0A480AY61_9BURK|nr:DUF6544 family protein [Rubrivivax pictus]GCL64685.1 hypothetical protein AQPW35_37660 [Rubrivivax pictus]